MPVPRVEGFSDENISVTDSSIIPFYVSGKYTIMIRNIWDGIDTCIDFITLPLLAATCYSYFFQLFALVVEKYKK